MQTTTGVADVRSDLRRSSSIAAGAIWFCRLMWTAILCAAAQSLAVSKVSASDPEFLDVARESGLEFQHSSPFTAERHLHLTMGSGLAWLDLDRDGWPDLCLGQGGAWKREGPSVVTAAALDRIYRNVHGLFRDVTELSGIENTQYTMGVAAGDFDNDGFCDLFVSNFGFHRLFVNNGDGTFRDVTSMLPQSDFIFSASCTWTDMDADGLLDLYVTNYLNIDPKDYAVCTQAYRGREVSIPCPPRKYPWPSDTMFRNLGDGTFADVSQSSGIHTAGRYPALGVVTVDLNDDRHSDVYVANDTTANLLLLNDGLGRFTDRGLVAGTAFNRLGEGEAGMGVASGDVDGDGRPDLFVVNYYGETNTLYRNEGNSMFLDVTAEFGLAAPSRTRLGFGTVLTDFDNDGWLDLFIANGHLSDRLEEIGMQIPFHQQPQLMWNDQGRRFRDVSRQAGEYFRRELLGRGCAVADFNRDGRSDIAVQNLNGPPGLLQNITEPNDTQSLSLELVGIHGNRSAVGARIEIELEKRTLVRFRDGSTSYLSCSDSVMIIGIGSASKINSIRVLWPGGGADEWKNPDLYQSLVLIEGRSECEVPK